MMADESRYCLKFDIYSGEKRETIEAGLGSRVVNELCENLENKRDHVYFFTSPKLMEELQQKHIYTLRTVNMTGKFMPKFIPDKELKRGNVTAALATRDWLQLSGRTKEA